MKYALVFLFALGLSFASMAQPPAMTLTNNTGCTFQVTLTCSPPPPACNQVCTAAVVCIFPGQVINVPGCGPDFFQWSIASVVPTTDDCQQPCPPATWVNVAPNGCAPAFAFNNHCHCGGYLAWWSSPFTLDLF